MTGGRLFNATFVRNLCEAEKVEDVEILQGLPGQDRLWRGNVSLQLFTAHPLVRGGFELHRQHPKRPAVLGRLVGIPVSSRWTFGCRARYREGAM